MGGDTSSTFDNTPWPCGESSSFIDDDYKTLELEFEANEKRRNSVYTQLLKSYDHLNDRVANIEVAKTKVLRYTPGSWVENIGGVTVSDYNVPKTTTILLIGPRRSGKSSLVNRISRVFEDDKFAPERAQVTYSSSIRDGTSFLQEYMIPRNSSSFCFYDTPGFFISSSENLEMIRQCMTKGVRHGELVKSSSLRARTACETCRDKLPTYERRRVDFVIFVVNGLSVLKCLESNGADTQYMHAIIEVFSSPFLSFKDHKPVIAITHGDLLSIFERARVRVYLGDLLGVHPSKQTFDIPDNCDPTTEIAIVDLVRYALEHADRNLPSKSRPAISKSTGSTILSWRHLLLLLAVGIFMFTAHLHVFRALKLNPENVAAPDLEIKKVTELHPDIVRVRDLEIKEVGEFDQEIVPEPDLEVTKFDQESVPEPDLDKFKAREFDQEVVREPDLEVMKFDQEIVTEPDLKVTKFDQEIVPERDLDKIKAREFDQEVPEPDLEIKKVRESDQQIVTKSDMEIQKVTKSDEPDLEIKEVAEIDPGSVPEHILEMKKVIPESIPKPRKKTKKVDAEKKAGKNKNIKKVRVPKPIMKVDWNTIRHIW